MQRRTFASLLFVTLCMAGNGRRAVAQVALPATTSPAAAEVDAAALYRQAADLAAVDFPSSSPLEFPPCPPFSPEWLATAKAAWEPNAASRQLVRQARVASAAKWPVRALQPNNRQADDPLVYNQTRHLANQLGDAALYAQLQGDHAEAVRLIADELHMANLLERSDGGNRLRMLVAGGIRALAANRLMIVSSDVKLTNDPANTRDLNTADAAAMIATLLDQWPLKRQLEVAREGQPAGTDLALPDRAPENFNRVAAELNGAAVSLACQVYRSQHARWPATLDELVPAHLPAVPTDPWATADEADPNDPVAPPEATPLGIVLIKHGLPDGGDRPLVYWRCDARDGLFYRVDAPQYAFYVGDGSNRPMAQQTRGGQFRDIARWSPAGGRDPNAPTVQPLP